MAATGEFRIVYNDGYYYFELWANNGQMIFWSRPYASVASARSGIETFRKNISEIPELEIKRDKNNKFRWRFIKGAAVIEGISYDSKASATSNAASVKNFAATDIIVDCTKR